MKETSFENRLLTVLKSTPCYLTIKGLIELTQLFGEPAWSRKRVSTTINRLKNKGIGILVRNPYSPNVAYKYKASEDDIISCTSVEDDTLLEKVLDITKPIETAELDDLVTAEYADDAPVFLEEREGYAPVDHIFSDEEVEANSPIDPAEELFKSVTGYNYIGTDKISGKRISEDCTFVPFVDLPDDADKSVYKEVADSLIKMESECYPKPTTESCMHYIMANKPKTIKVTAIQAHYELSLADAACLMIKTSDEFDCVKVTMSNLKGVAL